MRSIVCIIENDEDIRQVLARVVRTIGLEPELYDSAEAFLRRTDRSGIGCLILDVELGGMSGLEMLEQLSEEELTFPVLLITGAHDAGTVAHSKQLGATIIDKPFDARALAQKVRAAVCADGHRRPS